MNRATANPPPSSSASMKTTVSTTVQLIEDRQIPRSHDAILRSLPAFDSETRLIHIDYICPPQLRLRQLGTRTHQSLRAIDIIYTGYAVDDPAKTTRLSDSLGLPTPCIHTSDPADLSQIGLTLTKLLDATSPDTGSTVVCLDSISVLLQYTSLKTVYVFLRECIRILTEYNAVGRFSFTPRLHSDETVARINSLFRAESTPDSREAP